MDTFKSIEKINIWNESLCQPISKRLVKKIPNLFFIFLLFQKCFELFAILIVFDEKYNSK